MREFESLSEQMDKPVIYAMLVHSAQTEEPRHGALLSRTREQRTAINKHLIFFDLEWIQLSDETADKLAAHAKLERYRHFLELKRVWKPHYLSEPEEKLLDEKSITGKAAFGRLFEETISSLKFPFPSEAAMSRARSTSKGMAQSHDPVTASGPVVVSSPDHTALEQISLQEILAKLYDADREVRRLAAEGISSTLKENARLLTFIFNNIVLDHQSDMPAQEISRARWPRAISPTRSTDQVVEALMTAAEKHYGSCSATTVSRANCSRSTGSTITTAMPRFERDPPPAIGRRPGAIVQRKLPGLQPAGRRDHPQVLRRRTGSTPSCGPASAAALSPPARVPSVHPYILMNFTDRIRDVMTLAHELGHGLHQYLSRGQGYLQCDTPLTTAEMASVFGEMLTFQRLLNVYPEPKGAWRCCAARSRTASPRSFARWC